METQKPLIAQGSTDRPLTDDEARRIVAAAAEEIRPDGAAVLVIVPDHTRTCPLPMLTRALHAELHGRAKRLDFLVALGTHPPLDRAHLDKLFGVEPDQWVTVFPGSQVYNHEWRNPDALAHIGILSEEEVDEISGGLFRMSVDVTVNRRVFDYDRVLILGPVFPHEVVGFSGGNKYFFPGICGADLLNFFHWLGAVITSPKIIGAKLTPVRTTVDRAAGLLKMEKSALCLVVSHDGLMGMYFDTPERAWSAAADLSSRVHVRTVDKPYRSVLARAPEMYDDIWTGGKCMYKLEPVVADGGELIIYAPHITEVSTTHGKVIEEIGYHTRDYFLAQWDQFKDYPWGVLAHSTHVRGIGAFEDGVEKCRIRVTLATGIDEDRCRRINLGYRDPASIDVSEWAGREDQGRLYVPKAGEYLYKLSNPPAWQRFA